MPAVDGAQSGQMVNNSALYIMSHSLTYSLLGNWLIDE